MNVITTSNLSDVSFSKDPEMMTIPIDDKALVRGYALKEQILISNNKLYLVI